MIQNFKLTNLTPTKNFLAVGLLVTASLQAGAVDKDKDKDKGKQKNEVQKIIAGWPAQTRVVSLQMINKYGEPDEVSSRALVWLNKGEFLRIKLLKEAVPHDFPKPHMDFLEETIAYQVPVDKIDDLAAFDGSLTVNRTAGELSARCDQEQNNILALNLADEIARGDLSAEEARKKLGQSLVDQLSEKQVDILQKLQFEPKSKGAAFLDQPTIPGSPIRGDKSSEAKAAGSDQEILATLAAVDESEVLATREALSKDLSDPVREYATRLQADHGQDLVKIFELSQSEKIKMIDGKKVESLKTKSAESLAELIPLQGKKFEKAFLDSMVKQHEKVLKMIDDELIPQAKNDSVKKHLEDCRDQIAKHLEDGKKLQRDQD